MGPVLDALFSALRDLREPRILALVLVPPAAAFVLWAGLAWAYWSDWIRSVEGLLAATAVGRWILAFDPGWIVSSAAALVLTVLLIPLMLITAVVVTELLVMPFAVALIGSRDFARLERRRGGTVSGSVWNAATGILWFATLWVVTLPLWLTGIGALVLPALLSAYLNQRLFRYDALSDHASAEEYGRIVSEGKGRLFLLGLLLALLYYVPVLNLLVPVLSALAFTHLCLGELARLRQVTK